VERISDTTVEMKSNILNVSMLALFDKFLKFVVLLVLSRILAPEDFGVIAAATVTIFFFDLFSNVGLGQYLIQTKRLTSKLIESTLFVNVLLTFVVSVVYMLALPYVAGIIKVDELESFGNVLVLILFARSFSVVYESLLQRELKAFNVILCSSLGYLFSLCFVVIPLLLLEFSYMALIWGMVVESLIIAILLVKVHGALLLPKPCFKEIKSLYGNGGGYFKYRLFEYASINIDYIIVSRYLGISALGFYSRAYRVMEYPSFVYRIAVDKVVFPLLSKKNASGKAVGEGFSDSLTLIVIVATFLFGCIASLSDEIIYILLGSAWAPAGEIVKILSVFGTYRLCYMMCNTYLKSAGKINTVARNSFFMLLLMGVGVCIGKEFGIYGVALSVGVSLLLISLISSFSIIKEFELKTLSVMLPILLILPLTLLYCAPSYFISNLGGGGIVKVISVTIINILIFFVVVRFCNVKIINEVRSQLITKIQGRFGRKVR
jgi:O-antigen/teichoic acid export membrane protein